MKQTAEGSNEWEEEFRWRCAEELRVVQKQREAEIRQRLFDLGWQEGIEGYEANRIPMIHPPLGVTSKLVPGFGVARPRSFLVLRLNYSAAC
ncbi:hypothetical protein BDV98DRAFT_568407 [Pterulicium gracile]|uniref:Uncharacterized protein n=1 Tax=Pterulicium gracile TaxID=1884261 RepID=A0A5C3QG49_9AGAR|nr:hypothetical protein BDV98DRAFT_568407 [Pterula gracilis]